MHEVPTGLQAPGDPHLWQCAGSTAEKPPIVVVCDLKRLPCGLVGASKGDQETQCVLWGQFNRFQVQVLC